ncbi:hypothetical protein LJC07_06830 [Christensenellaceae bacterium OttesenSCG-928-L17]|nr:hypothetical protein [Christensenellaceae bacterium OttesenSCG-928-L17]
MKRIRRLLAILLLITISISTPALAEGETVAASPLAVDSATLHDGMDMTYEQGYLPRVENGVATIVLPLTGRTYDSRVHLRADLGEPTGSPFVLGNYQQTLRGRSPYVFRLDIPLASNRINGAYPVVLTANYLDSNGAQQTQDFTVYVSITDGKAPADPDAALPKETVEKPELYISACKVTPEVVGGDDTFQVDITVENIGSLRARNARLTYGSEAEGILPAETNNSILLGSISNGDTVEAQLMFKTTKDVLSGSQPFTIALDYIDAYGGTYSQKREFFVEVTRPANISYDPIALPKEIAAGETVSLSANVFNIGKSTLRNVTVTLSGAGLFPTSSVFLGDILPGDAGYGEMKVFIGMLSMTAGYSENYGKTHGVYVISYQDDAGETYTIEQACSTEIKKPVIEGEKEEEEEDPASQWWMSMILGLAIIAIIVAVIVVGKFTRAMKLR